MIRTILIFFIIYSSFLTASDSIPLLQLAVIFPLFSHISGIYYVIENVRKYENKLFSYI